MIETSRRFAKLAVVKPGEEDEAEINKAFK